MCLYILKLEFYPRLGKTYCESSASGGVEPKAEIVSHDGMSQRSKNFRDDLPNQEKNQY